MAWTTPRTWVAGELVTKAMLDEQVRDNELYLKGDAAWIAPTFTNGWVNFGGVTLAAGYRRIGDVIYLRGTIKSGTIAAAAFTLPAGWRPFVQQIFISDSNNLIGRVTVAVSGNVIPQIGSNAYYTLDGICFSAVA
ncbi:MAG: hypothetical protein L0221_00635 [Chloroflexi bacterium]|nr:hypothetical protein [Chloroflexota bacterium]